MDLSETTCMFCNEKFSKLGNLKRHQTKSCTAPIDRFELQRELQSLRKSNSGTIVSVNNGTVENNNTNCHNTNCNNVTIMVTANPVQSLDYKCLSNEAIHKLVNDFTHPLNLRLMDLIKQLIANPLCPENHCAKYITKSPPLYNIVTINDNGEIINCIQNLKESCDRMKDPVLQGLKTRLRRYILDYSKQNGSDEDYEDVKSNLKDIRECLDNKAVYKALNSVLRNEVLHDIKMKLDRVV